MKSSLINGTIVLAAVATIAGTAQAKGGKKVYDLTCGIKVGAGTLEAVKTVRVDGAVASLAGASGFGSYSVRAERHHIAATVTESATNQSNQFTGEIEMHGAGAGVDDTPHVEQGASGFELSVLPAESGSDKVTLVCSGKKATP